MGDFPRVVRVVVASPDDVDGVSEAADREPAEIEAVVDAPQHEKGDDARHVGSQIGEEEGLEEGDAIAEEGVQRDQLRLNPVVVDGPLISPLRPHRRGQDRYSRHCRGQPAESTLHQPYLHL